MYAVGDLPISLSAEGTTEFAYTLRSLSTDRGFMVIVMSVVYLNLISIFSLGGTNLLLINGDMVMSMSVIESMTVPVTVMMMASCRVHPKQVDCQSDTTDP